MKTVLITGASSGFGEACAQKFAEQDTRLILLARNLEKLDALAEKLAGKCAKVFTASVDVSDPDSIDAFFADSGVPANETDILLNSAGLALGLEPAWETKASDWETMVDTNIKGLMRMCRAVLPGMVERDRGHIINFGSTAGSWPYPGSNVYGGTKAFVENFSQGLRSDLLGHHVRVTNLAPGMAQTNFSSVRFSGDDAKADQVYANSKPLMAEDLAEIAYFVTSLPPHVNVNSMEIMAVCQAWGPLLVNRDMD